MTTVTEHCERANRTYQVQKRVLVEEAGGPRDALAMLEIWDATGMMHLVAVQRPELGAVCEAASRGQFTAGVAVEAVVYSSDAIQRSFDERTGETGEPHEVLTTLAVEAAGEFATLVQPYSYEGGRIVMGVPEVHHLVDSTVLEDLRRAFQASE